MIRGVELRDFMSYEHAFVPLSPGLNLICGPNGSPVASPTWSAGAAPRPVCPLSSTTRLMGAANSSPIGGRTAYP